MKTELKQDDYSPKEDLVLMQLEKVSSPAANGTAWPHTTPHLQDGDDFIQSLETDSVLLFAMNNVKVLEGGFQFVKSGHHRQIRSDYRCRFVVNQARQHTKYLDLCAFTLQLCVVLN